MYWEKREASGESYYCFIYWDQNEQRNIRMKRSEIPQDITTDKQADAFCRLKESEHEAAKMRIERKLSWQKKFYDFEELLEVFEKEAINCKDIDAFLRKKEPVENAPHMGRHIVVVDEAAEMFLAGHHAKAKEIQAARAILSRIARQGRAVGVHLVVATQRPDTRSLDPQVKANLTGVVCFQMMNDSSSIAVLGNGRATDLPKVPGRAIWKNGIEMIEIQTPLLLVEEAEALLGEPDQKLDPNAKPEEVKSDSSDSGVLSKEEALSVQTD